MRQKKPNYDVLLETYKRMVADDNRMLTEQNKEIVRLQEELKHAKRLWGLYEACLNKGVKIDFPDADYFLIWHKPSAPYICLEPWSGMADREDSDYDITKRDSIISLGFNKEYTNTHTVTIF
jgi:galactose mutarotase-like enzyme